MSSTFPTRKRFRPLLALSTQDFQGRISLKIALSAGKPKAPGNPDSDDQPGVNGTWMAEFPKKITDDPYGAAILIRRLVVEQGAVYWRRYLMAFALMAVSAATTAGSAY